MHKSVFNHQIWNYFVNDIESCFNSARNALTNGGKGGQNFTAAIVIFTVLDFCAGFYLGKVEPSLNLNAREVSDFITKFLGDRNDIFRNSEFSLKFYEVFRHGLVHQWSPKFAGVAMDFNTEDILFEEQGILCLNVPPFFKLVRTALEDFEKYLDDNITAQEKFETRLEAILTKDAQEVLVLKGMLEF